jgi:hypothetical protein
MGAYAVDAVANLRYHAFFESGFTDLSQAIGPEVRLRLAILGAAVRLRLLVVLSCLLTACAAAPLASAPTNVSSGNPSIQKVVVNISQFRPGEERDSIVKEIGEPAIVSDQSNGERCEVYAVQKVGQKLTFHSIRPQHQGMDRFRPKKLDRFTYLANTMIRPIVS